MGCRRTAERVPEPRPATKWNAFGRKRSCQLGRMHMYVPRYVDGEEGVLLDLDLAFGAPSLLISQSIPRVYTREFRMSRLGATPRSSIAPRRRVVAARMLVRKIRS